MCFVLNKNDKFKRVSGSYYLSEFNYLSVSSKLFIVKDHVKKIFQGSERKQIK